MELALNVLWVLLGLVAALFRWRCHSARARKYQALPASILALGCALALLFPIISVSDDLNAEQPAMEESSRLTLNGKQAIQGCLQVEKDTIPSVLIVRQNTPSVCRFIVAWVLCRDFSYPHQEPIRPSEIRSPPLPQA